MISTLQERADLITRIEAIRAAPTTKGEFMSDGGVWAPCGDEGDGVRRLSHSEIVALLNDWAALSRRAIPREAAEAARHAVELEQCSLFVDSPPLAKAMTDAAAYLRALAPSPPTPRGIGREELARWLLQRYEESTDRVADRIMADTVHLGKPPCKMAATCDACVRGEYLKDADAILARIHPEPQS